MELSKIGDQVFAAQCLLQKRIKQKKVEFLVKWKGWSSKYNSWEPIENILDLRLIDAFNNQTNRKLQKIDDGNKCGSESSASSSSSEDSSSDESKSEESVSPSKATTYSISNKTSHKQSPNKTKEQRYVSPIKLKSNATYDSMQKMLRLKQQAEQRLLIGREISTRLQSKSAELLVAEKIPVNTEQLQIEAPIVDTQNSNQLIVNDFPIKRGKGRPKGVKNKPKILDNKIPEMQPDLKQMPEMQLDSLSSPSPSKKMFHTYQLPERANYLLNTVYITDIATEDGGFITIKESTDGENFFKY